MATTRTGRRNRRKRPRRQIHKIAPRLQQGVLSPDALKTLAELQAHFLVLRARGVFYFS